MISDERIQQLAADAGLPLGVRDQYAGAINLLARAIEREAIAKPVRLMTEWREAKDAKFAATWDEYERAAMRLDAAGKAIRDYLERMK